MPTDASGILGLPVDESPSLRFKSISILDWTTGPESKPPLGGKASLELSEERTVLVGRNGSGKSAFLEGTLAAAKEATGKKVDGPRAFACEISGLSDVLSYSFSEEWVNDAPIWTEVCRFPGTRVAWEVRGGVVVDRETAAQQLIPSTSGLLSIRDSRPSAQRLRQALLGIRLIRAGVPRASEVRAPITFRRVERKPGSVSWTPSTKANPRIDRIGAHLIKWSMLLSDRYAEFEAIGRRIGLFQKLSVTHFNKPATERATFAEVEIDGVNLGLLSDGTLRTCEIILALVQPTVRLLMIEEPETGIHPGLLRKILAELDAYAGDKQIVVSTHSPAVVDWARADELRLVAREKGVTTLRTIPEDERTALHRYLDEKGALSEFVFLRSTED